MMAEHGGGFPWRYKGSLLLPRPSSSAPPLFGTPGALYSSSSLSSAIGRSVAQRIHSQAEKRRRERINVHLSTLRRMIPGANKVMTCDILSSSSVSLLQIYMDKASLLARVVDQVKSLKRKAIDNNRGFTIPAEEDDVTVMECHAVDGVSSSSASKILYVKASICCDDRPDLFADLTQVFNGLRLRTIRADMTSCGGRVQNAFVLRHSDDNASLCMSTLKESLREALGRVVSPAMDLAPQNDDLSGKRQKLVRSQCFNMSL